MVLPPGVGAGGGGRQGVSGGTGGGEWGLRLGWWAEGDRRRGVSGGTGGDDEWHIP